MLYSSIRYLDKPGKKSGMHELAIVYSTNLLYKIVKIWWDLGFVRGWSRNMYWLIYDFKLKSQMSLREEAKSWEKKRLYKKITSFKFFPSLSFAVIHHLDSHIFYRKLTLLNSFYISIFSFLYMYVYNIFDFRPVILTSWIFIITK